MTNSGRTFRLRGKGLPTKSGHGDLFATTEIRLPEVVDDGVNGILEPVGSVEAMGRRAVELLRDQARHERMREAAIAKAREFSADRIVPLYESLYEEVIR